MPPRDREVLMVFQDCALYPHISAYQNTALPLRARGARTERITEAVRQTPVYARHRPAVESQARLKSLHRRLQTTCTCVTPDQTEPSHRLI